MVDLHRVREGCPVSADSAGVRADTCLFIPAGYTAGLCQDIPPERQPMCGIVGAIADRDVVPVLVDGLKRLEYRGYDSAGIAILGDDCVRRVRRTGRVAEMEAAAASEGFASSLGIGH